MMIGGGSKKVEERKKCALVVDDDPLIRRIHGMLLTKRGFETETAENGQEAVDLFLGGKTFDLVLIDKDMPVMDGLEATRMVRGMGVRCMIVGVTARGLDAEKAAFMEAGLDFFWEKPLNAQAVTSILDELAKKSF